MTNLNELVDILSNKLNNNQASIQFDISADRAEYDDNRRFANGFKIPCVLSAGSGQYMPIQGLKAHTLPIYLECWGYACLDEETPAVPFTVEEQKNCLEQAVEELNGTTQVIGDSVIVFAGSTVTVGVASNYSGCGYTRLPFLVQMTITVIDGAVLFNDMVVTLDNERMFFTSFSVSLARQGKSVTEIGTTVGKTNCEEQTRSFAGVALMPKINGRQAFMSLYNEILKGQELNKKRTLEVTIDGIEEEYTVVIVNASIGGQMGGVMQLNLTMAEAWEDE